MELLLFPHERTETESKPLLFKTSLQYLSTRPAQTSRQIQLHQITGWSVFLQQKYISSYNNNFNYYWWLSHHSTQLRTANILTNLSHNSNQNIPQIISMFRSYSYDVPLHTTRNLLPFHNLVSCKKWLQDLIYMIQIHATPLNKSQKECYMSCLGDIRYLADGTRLDVAFAVIKLTKFVTRPTTTHLVLLHPLVHYLNATWQLE